MVFCASRSDADILQQTSVLHRTSAAGHFHDYRYCLELSLWWALALGIGPFTLYNFPISQASQMRGIGFFLDNLAEKMLQVLYLAHPLRRRRP